MRTAAATIALLTIGLFPVAADDLATATQTFKASVEQYLYCNIADGTITLSPVPGSTPATWTGSAAFQARANVPFQITHGWQNWTLGPTGFSGATGITTGATFGSDRYIAPADRDKTGYVSVNVFATGVAPPYPVASGKVNDQAAVQKLEDGGSYTPVGTVQLTLSVLF